jgi:hypothetical protein
VPRERLSYQHLVGLDAFLVRTNQNSKAVLSRIFDFSSASQTAPQLAVNAG